MGAPRLRQCERRAALISEMHEERLGTCLRQVVGALPSARLAGALGGVLGGGPDLELVARLEWLRGWAAKAAEADADEHCRMLASACLSMQARKPLRPFILYFFGSLLNSSAVTMLQSTRTQCFKSGRLTISVCFVHR